MLYQLSYSRKILMSVVPLIGIEPITYWLQVSCSTRWAKAAYIMAGVTRLELATSCVTGRRSNQTELHPHFFYGGHNRTWTYDPLLVRQVLSQLSYATIFKKWCPEAESNHRHGDFQSPALPTELSGHNILWRKARDSNSKVLRRRFSRPVPYQLG